MTRRDVFWELGGFDESHLPVAFQDVDYCLRLGERGYRIIYTPYSRLYHYESKTKTDENFMPTASETHYLRTRWKRIIAHDPFYSPNLSRSREDYSYVRD
jgi:GT2 family glycosyltransferase